MEIENMPALPRKYLTLTRKNNHTHRSDCLIDLPTADPTPDYYDPNEAALYQAGSC